MMIYPYNIIYYICLAITIIPLCKTENAVLFRLKWKWSYCQIIRDDFFKDCLSKLVIRV